VTHAEAHERRQVAGKNLLAAWGLAIVPNFLAAMGVDFPDVWWWYVIRYSLSAVFTVALVVWLVWLWRERRARRFTDPSQRG
jgi:Flp pilus assembly protein TadB